MLKTTPDYKTYGGVRPPIPDWAVEVAYRNPLQGEVFLSVGEPSPVFCFASDWSEGPRIILARKPDDLDHRLVPPSGYRFKLDQYGRPVCRTWDSQEWICNTAGDAVRANYASTSPHNAAYILEKIEPERKPMTCQGAKVVAGIISKHYIQRVGHPETKIHIDLLPDPFDMAKEDWEVVE